MKKSSEEASITEQPPSQPVVLPTSVPEETFDDDTSVDDLLVSSPPESALLAPLLEFISTPTKATADLSSAVEEPTPTNGSLRKIRTPAKGSAQESLAEQRKASKTPTPDSSKGKLKDAKEVIAEQAQQRKRKKESTGRIRKARRKHESGEQDATSSSPATLVQQSLAGDDIVVIPVIPPLPIEQILIIERLIDTVDLAKFPTPAPHVVDSAWLDRVAYAMIDVVIREGPPYETKSIFTADWSYRKLRVLATLGFIPAWWWVREGLVGSMMGKRDMSIRDDIMVQTWKTAEDMIRARDMARG